MKNPFLKVPAGLKAVLSAIPVALGLIAVSDTAEASSATAWLEVQSNPSVAGYSEFILAYPRSAQAGEAFCALSLLNEAAPTATEEQLREDYPFVSVDLTTCATTASARLFNV
jgi:hypothetical protein